MRVYALVLGSFVLAASATSCTNPGKPGGGATPLPSVAPLKAASLPDWIVEISPKGTAQAGAQIRIRFKNDAIPLDVLESPDRQSALSHFSLTPALPGRFLFLTPRMVGFEADAPIPNATRVRVTLTSGLADLKGNTLAGDFSWTFSTQPIALSGLPGSDSTELDPVGLRPTIGLSSNTALDEQSLASHTQLIDTFDPKAKPVEVALVVNASPSPTDPYQAQGADQEPSFYYALRPNGNLSGSRTYRIVVAPGVVPQHGNVPTAASYQGKLRVYGPLEFGGVTASGGDARFAGGAPVLTFSNGLDAASARKSITISPSPNPGIGVVGAYDGTTSININAYALNPRTHYAISVATTLKDQFGQKLDRPASTTFDTSDLVADIWAPSGLNVFPADANLQLNVQTTNLPDGRYQTAFRSLAPQDLIAHSEDNAAAFLPAQANWAWQPAPKGLNLPAMTPIALRQKLGGATGMFAYGVSAKTIHTAQGWQSPAYTGVVQSTDIGIFAQWFPNGGIVRTAHLSDGRPLPGARVDIYESYLYQQTKHSLATTPCASGTTDAGGNLALDGASFASCLSTAANAQSAPSLLVVVHNGADWAFVRADDDSGTWNAGFYGGWSAGAPDSHGTIVSDRTLYQPGETAQFVAVAYFDENGSLVRGRASSYAVSIQDPNGKKTALGSRAPDAFGSFTIAYPVSKRAAVGYYQIAASSSNGETLNGGFRVAEFKPPNFKVDLALDAPRATAGAVINAKTVSTYLFGAPVEGGKSHYYVTRSQSSYVAAGWEQYDFGRSWYYPEEPPSVDPDVTQEDLTIAADGTSTLSVNVGNDLPYAMDYRVDSETTDVSNLSVADSKTFVAFPGDATIGLHGDFVATAGTPFKVDAIALGLDGKPRTDKKLKLVLQQRAFNSATQVVEGSETPRDSIHYTDIATQEVSPGSTPAPVTFTAPKPGSYRIRANFSGASNDATATDHDLWVSGDGEFSWGGDNQNLTVKLDKKIYRNGETATALIQSPYADADLFFAVIRHGVLYRKTLATHGPAPQIRFTVTPEMLPNAAIEAVLVRRGTPLAQGVPPGLNNSKLARAGFATFNVALDAKYVKVDVKAAVAQPQPGTKQHVTFRITGRDGKPAAGELAVAVVNDAILNLTGYRFPDVVKIVYANQPISTRFADNRALVTLLTERKYVDKGFGYGGGMAASPGSTRVRTNFQPIAYWNGALRSDASGNASVDFTLPDDLTTWRVMAIAMTADARFGNGESSFIATKPLVTNAIVPQFARPGDTFSLGVSVTNIGKQPGDANVQATLGGGLIFADGSRTKSLQAATQGLVSAYRFDVNASGTGDANVKFVTKLGANADAFAVPLQLRVNDTLETVATTGATTTTASVPLDVPQSPIGGLEFTLASTMLGELSGPQTLLKLDRGAPFATALASRIAIAADTIVLDRQSGATAPIAGLQKTLLADLDVLESQALPDGGYAPWPGAKKSDIWSTAFIATQLAQARAAGYHPAGIAHVQRYLNAFLADPSDGCPLSTDLCFAENRLEALETLGTLGDARSDHLSDIWTLHEKFSYIEQVELARHLLKVSGWHDQGVTLRDKLLEQVYETARHAAVTGPAGFETGVAGQAQILGLMLDSHLDVNRVDKTVTSLLATRGRDGTWACLCDDAEALNALVAYAQGAGKPGTFTASVAVGALTGHAAFSGAANALHVIDYPLGGKSGVAAGKTSATLTKTGDGTLHYAVALSYRPPDVAAGVYSGIRIDRRLHAVNDPAVIASFGLAPVAADATHVTTNRVFEVEDRITADHPLNDVMLSDPLPAGFETVDTGFRTATPYFQAHADNWQIDYQAIYSDRVVAFAHYLPAGVYAVHYLVRSVTPGSFLWPGATVSLEYAPEEFGRTTSTRLTIDQPK
jgi:uncharacterized protein YfaS (alpha-2-macroglobulin family)